MKFNIPPGDYIVSLLWWI